MSICLAYIPGSSSRSLGVALESRLPLICYQITNSTQGCSYRVQHALGVTPRAGFTNAGTCRAVSAGLGSGWSDQLTKGSLRLGILIKNLTAGEAYSFQATLGYLSTVKLSSKASDTIHMPPAVLQSSSSVAIKLDKGATFNVGETISGYVLRTSPFVDPDASVCICLYAKTKAVIQFSSGFTHARYRSCFNLPGGSSEFQRIHQGPICISPESPGSGWWPFAVTIPRHSDLASIRNGNLDERSYLSVHGVLLQALPLRFSVKAKTSGLFVEAYTDYYLEAMMLGSGTMKAILI